MPWLGGEMQLRIDQLTKYWEQVSNAAHGRGARPLVSEGLANSIAGAHADFRDWRERVSGYQFAPSVEDEARTWRNVADHYAAAIRGEGKPAPDLAPWPKTTLEGAGNAFATGVGEVVAVVALAGIAWLLIAGRK